MKVLKYIPLLLVLTLFNSNAYAAQHCDEIKGNIVGKIFCKARSNVGDKNTENSSSLKKVKEDSAWKFWKKPEWMKKNN